VHIGKRGDSATSARGLLTVRDRGYGPVDGPDGKVATTKNPRKAGRGYSDLPQLSSESAHEFVSTDATSHTARRFDGQQRPDRRGRAAVTVHSPGTSAKVTRMSGHPLQPVAPPAPRIRHFRQATLSAYVGS
jgi:D-tyrosyl-tRNA(Tyr) deacylase